GYFSPAYLALTLLGAVLIQIGTNLSNDYFDFQKGADTHERLGPIRVTQAGLIAPKQVKAAFIFVFAMSACLGILLVLRGGWPILLIGLASILSGIAYTAGPYALAYLGLGELFVVIFFGPVAVAGTYYVQALRFNLEACWAGFAVALLSCAILTVNNLRDIDQDRKAHKKTLAVRFGPKFAHFEYIFCLLVPALIAFWLNVPAASLVILLALLKMRKSSLDKLLPQTALLVLVFAIVFSLNRLF
ncbi:MAG: 1,4-dihydroxy-2-naphthoate octaprenyltransferase, partial [Myxococcaceae bacterium]